MVPRIDTSYTANWHTSRDGLAIAAVVAHGTGGYDNDAGRRYLQRGGEKADGSDRKVSIHCYISKKGVIYRMVPDDKGANHAGAASAVLKVGTKTYRAGKINQVTLGFELANLQDGVDPYTEAQLNAMGWLIADWRRLHGPLPLYRHAEIDPTRRSDPVRLSVAAMEARVPDPSVDNDLTFLSPPRISPAVFNRILTEADSPAAPADPSLYAIPERYGIDPAVALAFFEHESKYGKVGVCKEFDTKNWGNVRTPYDPTLSTGSTPHPFAKYATWQDGLEDWCKRILYRYIGLWQLDTVRKALPKYAPGSDGNAPQRYADAVIANVRKWSALILPDAPSLPRLSLFRVSGKGGARVFAKPHTSATKVRLVLPGVEVAGIVVEGQRYRGIKSWLHLADDSGYIWRGSLSEVPV